MLNDRVISVLHIIESLDRGAVENWLLRMLSHARDCDIKVNWTFFCVLGKVGSLDGLARELGARVIYSPFPITKKIAFMRSLRAHIEQIKPDVIHCHHDIVSALYLMAAFGLGIKRRIVHVHNSDDHLPTNNLIKRRLGIIPLRWICLGADRIVGISNNTLDTMLGGRARRRGRDVVLSYGIDPSPFDVLSLERNEFRRSIQVADNAPIMLFGGRIVPEKNPVYAVDVLSKLRRYVPNAVLVYAGDGSEVLSVRERARALQVDESVRLIGWRDDLPALMCVCDWFILPRPEHPMEGFGLAVVEAQLAGLRLLLSLGISDDPLLPTASVKRLGLNAGPEAWARAAFELISTGPPDRIAARAALADSSMNMDRALQNLLEIYS